MFQLPNQPSGGNGSNNSSSSSSYASPYLSLGGSSSSPSYYGGSNNNNNGSSSITIIPPVGYQQSYVPSSYQQHHNNNNNHSSSGAGVGSFLLGGFAGIVSSTSTGANSNNTNNNNKLSLVGGDGSNNSNNNTTNLSISQQQQQTATGTIVFPHWRTLVDNMVVELMASLFVSLSTILCWTTSMTDTIQFMPSVVLGLVLICIKDEDYFFPDTSPTVTFVLWVLGGYTWIHVLARMIGQVLGFAIALWICLYAQVPMLVYRVEHTLTVAFALELIGTTLEHMAIVYVILPLLPPAHHHSTAVAESLRFVFPKVKPKSHHETQAPSNQVVLHAALVLGGLHWCLSRGMCIEMSPLQTLLVMILRWQKKGLSTPVGHDSSSSVGVASSSYHEVWSTATVALWAQAVGLLLCISYVLLFAPRETKYWPAILKLKP